MGVTLTVFFEEPFWVGMVQRVDEGKLSVARMVFGAEPSDQQVYAWVQRDYAQLRFSPAVDGAKEVRLAANPKRRQRQAARAKGSAPGTKSQIAMQLGREALKQERKTRSKEQREAEEQRKLDLRIAKKKAKHRGH